MALDFDVESWIWYGVVMWIGTSRFVSRWIAVGGWKGYQSDDYLMLLALCFYTTLIVTINIVAVTNSNLLPPGYNVDSMTQDDINERIYGSKLILVVEECQCCVIWAAKACLSIMYLRFTVLAKENLMIKILIGYIAGGFILMEILYLGVWCRPFYEYWAVPTDNVQCNAATDHLITNAVLNLTSDIAMLIIGLPIFIRVQVPLRQKVPLILLFSLGIFVIIAAILNKTYSFSNPFGTEWVFWYVRESSTALIVANMPFVWGLYKRILGFRPRTLAAKGTLSESRSHTGHTRWNYGLPHVARGSPATNVDTSTGKGLSAEQWLRDDYIASSASQHDEDVNPYTHPALYYSRLQQKKNPQHRVQDFERTDETAQQVGRPSIIPEIDESPGTSYLERPTSASNNRTSPGSFV